MASVDFKKLHTAVDVKRVLRHCDKDMRVQDNHNNEHINKQVTSLNQQRPRSYEDTCKLYDDIIAKHDEQPNANKRKDRVTCFALEIPCPAELAKDRKSLRKWFMSVDKIMSDHCGKDNILQSYVHFDEVHTYKDAETGQDRESVPHVHYAVIPLINGKLNGKQFSNKKNMITLNDRIEDMTERDFGVHWATGSKRKSKKEVETLKLQSEIRALQDEKRALEEDIARNRYIYELGQQAYQRQQQRALQADEITPDNNQMSSGAYGTSMSDL